MSVNCFLAACAAATAGAARLQQSEELVEQSDLHKAFMLDFVSPATDDPERLLSSLHSSLAQSDESFWARRRRSQRTDQPVADAPIGGTSPAWVAWWASWGPTVLAIDGSDTLGEVPTVYTFGAPSTAKTPLSNDKRDDGCFDGMRIFHSAAEAFDPVSWLCSAGGFKHASMSAMTLYQDHERPPQDLPCSEATSNYPAAQSVFQMALHFTEGYLQTVREEVRIPPRVEAYAALMRTVYVNHADAAELAEGVGYRFVAEAANGDDLTRLFQNPETLDCIISFRGSDNAGDWINNAGFGSRDFCNFAEVHSGFVNKFQNTVSAPQFQANIRAKLPRCSSVKATGHSLGGAVAEMFAACINRGSQGLPPLVDLPRGSGLTLEHVGWQTYMSYKGQIAWNRGSPELMLPYV